MTNQPHNIQELDKILDRVLSQETSREGGWAEYYADDEEYEESKPYGNPVSNQEALKQAILDWHNKQVKNAVATAEDNLDQYWNRELDKQIEEAMAKFHLKKGIKYDVKASDSVIVITHTNSLKERDDE